MLRNSVFGVASQAIGGTLFFLSGILIARHLGPERFGSFSFVFAIVTVFHMLADLGLINILTREIARARERASEILGAAIPLATILAVTGYALIVATASLLGIDAEARRAAYILGASVLITFHAAVYGSVSRAFEEMGINAAALVFQRIVLLLLVLAARAADAGLDGMALCYLGERLVQWIFFRVVIWHRYARYHWRRDAHFWRHLVREGLPVGIGMVLRRVSWQIDIFVLTALSTAGLVGLFGAAYRIVQMVSVIPFTLATPTFPLLSRLAIESPRRAFEVFARAQKGLVIIGMPVGIWIMALGPELIVMLFGDAYRQAGATLQLMGVAVILLFANGLFVYMFTAMGRQEQFTIAVGAAVLVNFALDLLLIPFLDIEGAALATVGSEITLFASGSALLALSGLATPYAQIFLKPLAVGLLSALVLAWPAIDPGPVPLALGSAVFLAVFIGLSLATRIISRAELLAVFDSLRPAEGRRRRETPQSPRSTR